MRAFTAFLSGYERDKAGTARPCCEFDGNGGYFSFGRSLTAVGMTGIKSVLWNGCLPVQILISIGIGLEAVCWIYLIIMGLRLRDY